MGLLPSLLATKIADPVREPSSRTPKYAPEAHERDRRFLRSKKLRRPATFSCVLGLACLRLAVNAHFFGYGVMGFARRGSFPTSVWLIRGGYRGAAPRAA